MKFFDDMKSFFNRLNEPERMGGMMPRNAPRTPIYQKPPTTAHSLRYTEALTPKSNTGLARAISISERPRKRERAEPYIPIYRPERTNNKGVF
jgi:hypothetical protein